MRPKKGTKAYNSEYVRVYYGIHSDTLEVQSVWQQRDGMLSGPNGGTHYNLHGADTRSEIFLVFNLQNARSIPVGSVDAMGSKVVEELKATAAAMKAEREAKQGTSDAAD